MITCPQCKMTSYNPNDAKYGWCDHCKDFTTRTPDTDQGREIRENTASIFEIESIISDFLDELGSP